LCDPSLTRANLSSLETSIAHIIKRYTSVLFTYLLTYLLNCFNNRPNLVMYLLFRATVWLRHLVTWTLSDTCDAGAAGTIRTCEWSRQLATCSTSASPSHGWLRRLTLRRSNIQ